MKMGQEFEDHVEQAMKEVVDAHQHNHPLYRPTVIHKGPIYDEENQRAAFVLFEQIDTDRCTPQGEGWLGDQYRYSVWVVEGDKKPRQLYEDHAYIRRWSKSELTGTRGRDASITLLELLPDAVLVEVTPQGVYVENQRREKVKLTLESKLGGK
jgi:hypothetical protein